jgi:hypothetical protein
MSKNCPNCMHTVRSGVNYCGYCGTILVPTPRNPAPTEKPHQKNSLDADLESIPLAQPNRKRARVGRSWVKVPIILLVVVIMLAMTLRFWPEIMLFLGQTIASVSL